MSEKPIPIPEPFDWDETFAVGYETLDHEHQMLFVAVRTLEAQPNSRTVLQYFVFTFAAHFTHEELKMRQVDFAGYASHKRKHEEFIRQLKCWEPPISAELIYYVKDWLVNHIHKADFLYKGRMDHIRTDMWKPDPEQLELLRKMKEASINSETAGTEI